MDNIEGIAQWRLLDQAISQSVDETMRGVEWLVKEGFLVRIQTAGAGALYQLSENRRARAEAFLAERKEAAEGI
jgi:hypothetical protein